MKIYVWCRDAWRPVEVSGLDSSGKPVYAEGACNGEQGDDSAAERGAERGWLDHQRFDRAA